MKRWGQNETDVGYAFKKRPGCVRRPRSDKRALGTLDAEPLQRFVAGLTEADWNAAGNERAATFEVHRDTSDIRVVERSFMHINSKSTVDPLHKEKHAPLRKLAEPLVDRAAYEYGYANLTVLRLLLVRLNAGGVISTHTDRGPGLLMSHRVHFPIISDAGVAFSGEHFGPGKLFELHNGKEHSVNNTSPRERVHLILDMYPKCEKVDEAEPLELM